jgi:capsular exopolysaccharide synthesis family protein
MQQNNPVHQQDDHHFQSEIDPSSHQIDLVSLFWRRKWMLLLGMLTGVLLGYLYYSQQPPVFQSLGRLQIVEPNVRNLPVQGIDSNISLQTNRLLDEAMVMRSETVLKRAAELGKLAEINVFAGRTPEQIAAQLARSRSLTIGLAKSDSGQVGTSVFEIQFQSSSPVATQAVVQSIIDTYGEHLRSKHSDVGKETLELIQSARGDVAQKLERLEREFDEFKKNNTTLVTRNGQATSIHRANADNYLAQQQALSMERTRLESRYNSARDAIRNQKPWASVLMSLMSDSTTELLALKEKEAVENPLNTRLPEEAPQFSRADELRERLILHEVKLRESLNEMGANHPTVKQMQQEIRGFREQIDKVDANDRDKLAKIREALKPTIAQRAEKTQAELDKEMEDQHKELVRLHILSGEQRLNAIKLELQEADKAYKREMEAAKLESMNEIEWARYDRDIARQLSLHQTIMKRFDELDIMRNSDGMRVLPMTFPALGSQIGPNMSRSLGMGGTLGLLVMGLLAYVFEWANKSYRSAEELAEHLRLPVIGQIPVYIDSGKAKKVKKEMASKLSPMLSTYFHSKGQHSEAYRAVRTALYFSNQGNGQRVLQVTSAVPADGKTTIASNMAISIAQSGKSVILIDCDLRRPQVHKCFGIDTKKGSAWLIENIGAKGVVASDLLGEVVHDTEVPNLSVITAGVKPDNPSELLSSGDFDRVLEALKEKFDVIVIDSPPLLAVTDPSNIASRVDGVILVVRLRRNVRPLAAQGARILETLGAKVMGVVVNGVGSREAGEYGKFYGRDGNNNRGQSYRYGYGYTYGYTYGSGYGYYNKYRHYYDRAEKPTVNGQVAHANSNGKHAKEPAESSG